MKLLQIAALALCLNIPTTHTMNNNTCSLQPDDLCKAVGIALTAIGCLTCATASYVFFTENNLLKVIGAALLIDGSMKMANAGFYGLDNCYK